MAPQVCIEESTMACKTLTYPLAFLLAGHVFAGDSPETSSQTSRLTCGHTTVTVSTTCRAEKLAGFPVCQAQAFTFTSHHQQFSRQAAGMLMRPNPPEPALLDYLASDWACQAGQQGHYLVVRYHNGGNCPVCEWHMIYDLRGTALTTRRKASFAQQQARLGLSSPVSMHSISIPFDGD